MPLLGITHTDGLDDLELDRQLQTGQVPDEYFGRYDYSGLLPDRELDAEERQAAA